MTSNPLRLACLSICLQASFAHAQDDAASRAQRDASNPLRMIIEASKLKPRQKAAEAEVATKAVPEKVAIRAPAAKPAAPASPPAAQVVAQAVAQAAPPERPGAIADAAQAEVARQVVLPSVGQPPSPAVNEAAPIATTDGPPALPSSTPVTPAAEPATPTGAPAVLNAVVTAPPAAAAPGSTSVSTDEPRPPSAQAPAPQLAIGVGSQSQAAAQVALASPSPAQPDPVSAQAPVRAARVSLQLADYVEPVLPDRLRRRLQGEAAVVVKFTVNPDGSVADVAVRSSSDRALDPIALDAVSQWRYKPIAAAQSHAVELVFKTAN